MVRAWMWSLMVLVIGVFFGLAGCSRDTGGAPKASGELSEEQKQQVRQLNEQRSQEWGGPKRK